MKSWMTSQCGVSLKDDHIGFSGLWPVARGPPPCLGAQHVSHGLGWTLAIVLSALLGFAPSIFDAMAKSLGVSYAPVLGIAIAIAALIIKALLTDIEVSKMRVRQQRLVQKVALLESELEELTGRAPLDD